jgi:leader peptidase (prepilin peptidase) / N-methyltransferase
MPESIITGSWVFLATMLGFLIGSFLNVCIYRLPAGITIVKGRSFCPNCRHPLSPADLVPVLSYLFLGRKCRYCREPISPRYARIELLSGFYFGLAAYIWLPWHLDLPAYINTILAGLDAVQMDTARIYLGIGLLLTAVITFSMLLVWAMIFYDGHLAPPRLFIFLVFMPALRLALQPGRLISHLIAVILVIVFFMILIWFKLLPETDIKTRLNLGAGFVILGAMAGLQAIQPILAVFLIELVILSLSQNRRKLSEQGQKRARQIWQSLPVQSLLIGAVLWLIL